MQKLPKQIAAKAGMAPHGNAGLQLRASGEAVTIAYTKRSADGPLDFDKLGWKNFIQAKNLQAGQPVLIILRKSTDPSLEIMIEMVLVD